MSAKAQAVRWIIQTLMFFAIYSLLCAISPDVALYNLYTANFGFVTELEWSENYTLVLFVLSFFINAALVYFLGQHGRRQQ